MLNKFDLTAYGSGHGLMLEARDKNYLSDFDKNTLFTLLKEAGFLLFRGFNTNPDTFKTFVHNSSNNIRISFDPVYRHSNQVVQWDADLHSELAWHRKVHSTMPDLCWFFCEKAALGTSQTLICDGYRVWNSLSESVRHHFLNKNLLCSKHIEQDQWKKFVFHYHEGKKPIQDICLNDLRELISDKKNTQIESNDNGSIFYTFRTPAVGETLFGERLAFSNSILIPACRYENPLITFEDGTPISARVMQEIIRVTDTVTEKIEWRDGDIILIDNTRVMHGYHTAPEPQRKIYNAVSYAHNRYRSTSIPA